MLIAQLTDLHVVDSEAEPRYGEPIVDTNDRLSQAVAALAAEQVQPDRVLLTGDLVDDPTPASMAVLAELLAPIEAPIVAVPGNHDDRELFREAFDLPYSADDHASWMVDIGDLVMIGLDTLDPPQPGGRFDEPRQDWLAMALASADGRPVAIAMHHPPFLTGMEAMDAMGMADDGNQRFADTIAPYPNLTRVFCGHMHRPISTTIGGVTASVGLPTVQAVHLNLRPASDLAVIDDPAGYSLHWFSAGNWVSHTRYIHPDVSPVAI